MEISELHRKTVTLEELKWALVLLLDPEPTWWEGDGARHAAMEQAAAQSSRYTEILVTAALSRHLQPANENILNAVRSQIPSTVAKTVEAKIADDGRVFIESSLPYLTQTAVETWKTSSASARTDLSEKDVTSLSNFIIGAIAFEAMHAGKFDIRIDLNNSPTFLASVMNYCALKAQLKTTKDKENPLMESLKSLRVSALKVFSEVNEQQKAVADIEKQYRDHIGNLEKSLEQTNSKVEELTDVLEKKSSDFLMILQQNQDDAAAKLLAHSKSTEDRLNLRKVTQRWQDVKQRAQNTLIGTAIFILALISLSILLIFINGQDIIDFLLPLNIKTIFLQSSAAGAVSMQIARIGIVAIPLASFFWVLKIALRIFMRSLALMDDADQRATIMDSYYALTGDGMTDDRALPMMLWAIFRPVPGHGPDGVEPPDFTEAINAGLKISRTP